RDFHVTGVQTCALPISTTEVSEGSPVMATVTEDGFVIEPTKAGSHCTVKSVSSLTMYENPDPWSIHQPSGRISTEHARFEQLDEDRKSTRLNSSHVKIS